MCACPVAPYIPSSRGGVGGDKCGEFETVMHILFECPAYERERFQLIQELGWLGVDKISLKLLLGNGSRQSRVNEILFKYLKNTGTIDRI